MTSETSEEVLARRARVASDVFVSLLGEVAGHPEFIEELESLLDVDLLAELDALSMAEDDAALAREVLGTLAAIEADPRFRAPDDEELLEPPPGADQEGIAELAGTALALAEDPEPPEPTALGETVVVLTTLGIAGLVLLAWMGQERTEETETIRTTDRDGRVVEIIKTKLGRRLSPKAIMAIGDAVSKVMAPVSSVVRGLRGQQPPTQDAPDSASSCED